MEVVKVILTHTRAAEVALKRRFYATDVVISATLSDNFQIKIRRKSMMLVQVRIKKEKYMTILRITSATTT